MEFFKKCILNLGLPLSVKIGCWFMLVMPLVLLFLAITHPGIPSQSEIDSGKVIMISFNRDPVLYILLLIGSFLLFGLLGYAFSGIFKGFFGYDAGNRKIMRESRYESGVC